MNGTSNLDLDDDEWSFVGTKNNGKRGLFFELLDCGNNRKVILEADRLLRRQPTFVLPKVFKALALIRLKYEDEAREILEPISKQVQTDGAVLQVLKYCYQELDEPLTLCRIFEGACKKAPSKGLLTQCFIAQVLSDKYNKQYLTALSIYKTYNDPTYFGRAIASLLTEGERLNSKSKDESAQNISFLLAERMLTKFIDEEKEKSREVEENILVLYLETLFKQGKWEDVLKALEKHFGLPKPSSKWVFDRFYEIYTEALLKLGRKSELFNYLKLCFMKNLDEYQIIEKIITIFQNDDEGKPWLKNLMTNLRSKHPSYVVALADLQYISNFNHDEIHSQEMELQQRISEDFQMASVFGAEKPSFHSDIGRFISITSEKEMLSSEMKLKFLEQLTESDQQNFKLINGNHNGGVAIPIGKIIKEVNYEMIHRHLFPDTTPILRMERAHRLLEKYFIGESLQSGKSKGEKKIEEKSSKESNFHDEFLVIAASTLLAKYDSDPLQIEHFFKDILSEVRSSKPGWICEPVEKKKKKKKGKENGIKIEALTLEEEETKESYHLKEQEYLLITSILLLEFGLQRSPLNSSLRILLIKAYCRIGAVKQALLVARGLDIKYVQWDSLAFLFIWRGLQSGSYFETRNFFDLAEEMYNEFKKEGKYNVLLAYHYNNLKMIPELLHFRDLLLNSTQHGMIKVEKRLQEFCWAGPSQVVGVAKNTVQALEFEEGEGIFGEDNRDFTMLQCLESQSEGEWEKLKKATGETNVLLLNARNALLVMITEVVLLAGNRSKDEDDLRSVGRRIEEGIKVFKGNLEEIPRRVGGFSGNVPNFDGLWPPPQVRYEEIGCVTLLVDLLGLVRQAVMNQVGEGDERGSETEDDATLVEMGKVLYEFWTEMKLKLKENVKNLNLLTMGKCLEDIHSVLETLKFSCILFHACLNLISVKKKQLNHKSSDSRSSIKRKTKVTPENEFTEKKPYFKSLHEALSSLRHVITEEIMHNPSCSKASSWENSSTKEWEGLIGKQLRDQVFSPFWNQVQSGILNSYHHQLKEFTIGIDTNLKFIAQAEVENGQ
ncbi:unnamed protein product [Orchesella dallaii]|uniref:N-alpha-acetyltransferase 25, NatB auxiliary subunit n=1 Tax=Orchesella dallaii TaxID=48710 RepID=A0ABP1QY45_9HEXA